MFLNDPSGGAFGVPQKDAGCAVIPLPIKFSGCSWIQASDRGEEMGNPFPPAPAFLTAFPKEAWRDNKAV